MTGCKKIYPVRVGILFSLLIVYVLGGCASMSPEPLGSPINYQERAKTIVVKVVRKSSPPAIGETGTGFIIAVIHQTAYIMTAKHVIEEDEEKNQDIPKIKVTFSNGLIKEVENTIEKDEDHDLALLKVKLLPGEKTGILETISNYCLLKPKEKEHGQLDFFTISNQWVPQTLDSMVKDKTKITFAGVVPFGNSGGPVIRKQQIVGLIINAGISGSRSKAEAGDIIGSFLDGLKPPGERDNIRKVFKDCEVNTKGGTSPAKPSPPPSSYKLTLKMIGNGSGTVIGNGNYEAGKSVTLTAQPSAGSEFAGWSPPSCAESFSMPNHNLTCFGQFNTSPSPSAELKMVTKPEMVSVGKCGLKVSKYEITYDQYREFCKGIGKNCKAQLGNEPVVQVSWDEATEYAEWLSRREGKEYRLPTSQEWDCFAGTYRTGHTICDYANLAGCGDNKLQPVGQLEPNEFGLYDIIGNVAEWIDDCSGRWDNNKSKNCAVRGAAYNNEHQTVSNVIKPEFKKFANWRINFIGFRLVRSFNR